MKAINFEDLIEISDQEQVEYLVDAMKRSGISGTSLVLAKIFDVFSTSDSSQVDFWQTEVVVTSSIVNVGTEFAQVGQVLISPKALQTFSDNGSAICSVRVFEGIIVLVNFDEVLVFSQEQKSLADFHYSSLLNRRTADSPIAATLRSDDSVEYLGRRSARVATTGNLGNYFRSFYFESEKPEDIVERLRPQFAAKYAADPHAIQEEAAKYFKDVTERIHQWTVDNQEAIRVANARKLLLLLFELPSDALEAAFEELPNGSLTTTDGTTMPSKGITIRFGVDPLIGPPMK